MISLSFPPDEAYCFNVERDGHLFDLCRGYLDAQAGIAAKRSTHLHALPQQPAVTISRETGSGAVSVAQLVAERMQEGETVKWAVFDRNLVERVIEDHEMPKMMQRFLPEDSPSAIASAVEEFFGLHPSAWTLVERTTETVLHLAKLGNVIVVGRGGAIITAGLKHVVHVRLVAPLDWRVNHCMKFYRMSKAAAEEFVKEKDAARARYVHKNFHAHLNDPLHYHLTINTGKVGFDTAADAIVDCVKALKTVCAGVGDLSSIKR